MDWRWVLSVAVIVCVGGPIWFFIFWHWFEFWRERRTLAYGVWALVFVVIGALVLVFKDPLFTARLHPPVGLRIVGWAVMAAVTVFGTIADRQIGVRVRSFLPFFDQHGHIDLKTTGAYAAVRHPIYATGVWFGLGLFFATGYYVLLVADALFTLGALWFTRQEEQRLMALLDDPAQYERYRERVGALFPRLRS